MCLFCASTVVCLWEAGEVGAGMVCSEGDEGKEASSHTYSEALERLPCEKGKIIYLL